MLEPDVLDALQRLPLRTQALWVGSRRPTAAVVEDQGPLDLMIWLDSKSRKVRTGMVVPRAQGADAMLVSLVQAMLAPAQELKPSRPGRVSVDDDASRTLLSRALAPVGIEVAAWTESQALDDAFSSMEQTLSRGPGITYLDKAGNTPELLGRFFETAVRLFEAAPWEGREETDLAAIEGLQPSPLYVSLFGGAELGLCIYLTRESARTAARGKTPTRDLLLMSYSHPDDMGPGVLVEASDHGWPLVDLECLPLLVRPDRTDDFVAHGTDVQLAIDVMEAVVKGLAQEEAAPQVELADGRILKLQRHARP